MKCWCFCEHCERWFPTREDYLLHMDSTSVATIDGEVVDVILHYPYASIEAMGGYHAE